MLGRASLTGADLDKMLDSLAGYDTSLEVAVLSTCMRTEIYAELDRFHDGVAEIMGSLARLMGIDEAELIDHSYTHFDRAAMSHLFRVAAGLDSPVLGETEILGQVKRAYEVAHRRQTAGPRLSLLFRRAIEAGKLVRTETVIARGVTSLSLAGVALAREQLGIDFTEASCLVLGCGTMGAQVARALADAQVGHLEVASRTHERAEDLAAQTGALPLDLAEAKERLHLADVVFSATGASGYVVEADDVTHALQRRRSRDTPLVLVDLAVPRDVDPVAGSFDGVTLVDMDGIRYFADAAMSDRKAELPRASALVEEEVERYRAELSSREVAPVISRWRAKLEHQRQAELERYRSRLAGLAPEQLEAVESLTRSLVAKIAHQPSVELKRAASRGRSERAIEALTRLFDLS
jgi:glutamyl-tRNA reductase